MSDNSLKVVSLKVTTTCARSASTIAVGLRSLRRKEQSKKSKRKKQIRSLPNFLVVLEMLKLSRMIQNTSSCMDVSLETQLRISLHCLMTWTLKLMAGLRAIISLWFCQMHSWISTARQADPLWMLTLETKSSLNGTKETYTRIGMSHS